MESYVDVVGLSLTEPDLLAEIFGPPSELGPDPVGYRIDGEQRLTLLAELIEGAGVTIYTGPWGREFWSIVSPEVKVRVVPDGYEFKDRRSEWEWAVINEGGTPADARGLLEKPPVRGGRLRLFTAARERLNNLGVVKVGSTPRISQTFPIDILTPDDGAALLQTLAEQQEFVALDYEWERDTRDGIRGASLSTLKRNVYIPVRTPEDSERILLAVEHALKNGLSVVCHNGRADLGRHKQPIDLFGTSVDDTLIMAYLLGETGDLGLKELTRKHLGRDPVEWSPEFENWSVERQARYAGMDTRNTYDLCSLFVSRLLDQGMYEFYVDIEKPLVPVVAQMEKTGSPLDMELAEVMAGRYNRAKERIRRHFLPEFDIAEDEGIRALVKARSGRDPGSVAKPVLSQIPDRYIDYILKYRAFHTRENNFLRHKLEKWEGLGRPADFRMYSKFNQAGSTADGESFKTAPRTGRFSSSGEEKEGQLQNQPRDLRRMFIGEDGCLYWSKDYSGLELMISAALSGDPEMLRVLLAVCPNPPCTHKPKCGDLHAAFQWHIKQLTGVLVEREVAKQGMFEQQYRGGPDKLMSILAQKRAYINYETAKAIVDTHHEVYKVYHQWGDARIEEARSKGYSEDYFGRRRYMPELYSRDDRIRGGAERAAVNMGVQGPAATIVKMAMRDIVRPVLYHRAHIATQVHDEITGWVPIETAEHFMTDISEIMDGYFINGIQLKTAGGLGKSWKDAK